MIPKELNKADCGWLSGRRALVVGLGRTGVAAARFLKRCGAVVTATDIRPESGLRGTEDLKRLGVRIEAGGHVKESFFGSDLILVSPGVPSTMELLREARDRGVEVMSDIELLYRSMDVPVLAVTGTNGKSTTTALLSEVLRRDGRRVFVGGNIGIPVTEYFDSEEGYDWCVLEISSFQLETVSTFRPHVAVLLNVTHDHLDRYENFDDYAATKLSIFSNQGPADYAVVNSADPVIAAAMEEGAFRATIVPFTAYDGSCDGLYLDGDRVVVNGPFKKKESYPLEGVPLTGIHNIENIMAVIAAARAVGVERDKLLDAIRGFKGLPHRMEFVREVAGVRYINDSKSTNTGSLFRALESMPNGRGVVLIAGGRDKGGDYGFLKDLVREKVRLLVAMGESRTKLADTFAHVTDTVQAADLEDAVRIASASAGPGDTVLFSPACSSFDMFTDFRERGERFRGLVEAL